MSRDGVGPVTREINRQLYALTEPARFATLFWGIFDANRRTLKYSNAGQNPPLLHRDVFADSPAVARRRSDVERLRAGGVPLGAFAEAAYREDTVVLRPGDLLAIFTDGITEALDAAEEEFGDERLERLLRENANLPAADLCRIVMEAVDEHLAGIPPKDDMTLVIARVLPL